MLPKRGLIEDKVPLKQAKISRSVTYPQDEGVGAGAIPGITAIPRQRAQHLVDWNVTIKQMLLGARLKPAKMCVHCIFNFDTDLQSTAP